MFCPDCEMRVETEFFTRKEEWTDNDDYHYGDLEYNGDYPPQETGTTFHVDGKAWTVGTRVDLCMNCGYPLQVRTFLH